MTTSIVVKAHAWPVDVTSIDPRTSMEIQPAARVAQSEERTFYVHSGMDLRIHEVQSDEGTADAKAPSSILKHFAFAHLPAHLQEVSRPIGQIAALLDGILPDGPEKSAGLRKLLEAKDCMVRAKLG